MTPVSPLVKLAGIGIISIGFFYLSSVLDQATTWTQKLPVEGNTFSSEKRPPLAGTAATGAGIHPLLVESSRKEAELRGAVPKGSEAVMVSLDTLFGRTAAQQDIIAAESPVPAAKSLVLPPVIAYDDARSLLQATRLQMVASNGAIINGLFYGTGDVVDSVSYFSGRTESMASPILTFVGKDHILLSEVGKNGKTVSVQLPD
jgi:hypothetical protein